MVSATTGKPEKIFVLSEDEIRLGTMPLQPIEVYLLEPGSPTAMAIAFADSGALLWYPSPDIAIDTWVYSVAENANIERPSVAAQPKATEHESRMAEISWLSSQRELRVRLAGQWIAVEGERLIAHGQRLTKVVEEARSCGVEHPLLVCLPEVDEEDIAIIV